MVEEFVMNVGFCKRWVVIVDWFGLGFLDRFVLEYIVDMYEKFLVDFVIVVNGFLVGV